MFKYIKMPVTGEDIITKVKTITNSVWVLDNPAVVITDNNGKFGLVPYAPFAKDGLVTVSDDLVKIQAEVHDQVLSDYKRVFHPNDIIVPDNKIIV